MFKLRSAAGAFLLLCLATTGARAQSDAEHTLDAIFHLFDEDNDGVITNAEANHYIDKTFKEMDGNHDGRITTADFRNFSFGLADVAAAEGKSDSYEKAKDAIFKRWDKSGKGALTLSDYRAGVLADAEAAQRGGKRAQAGRFDMGTFKRAPFIKEMMKSLR